MRTLMTGTMNFFLIAAACLAIGAVPELPAQSVSAPIHADSIPPVLVELFTSEGCSSCLPADAALQEINGKKTAAGRLIVGISEHVTYWNHLGWTDPFSAESYTERQNGYAQRFHLDDVYTPQMMIDGRDQLVGSDRTGLAAALNRKSAGASVSINIVSAE